MDSGSGECLSASEDVVTRCDALKNLYTERSQCDCRSPGNINISIDDLGNNLIEVLSVGEDQILPSKSISCQSCKKTGKCNVEMEDECEDPDQMESETVTSEKCLSKCATFPFSAKKSISLPLLSAMKGSREKQGTTTLKKLTVTWSPDVYDPPPSARTFVRNSKSRRKNERKKKSGKNKAKGIPSKWVGSKDKKHVRKYGESCNNCYLCPSTIVDRNEACVKLRDFGVGSSDAYCGSSFLSTSITKFHFSIAEAK